MKGEQISFYSEINEQPDISGGIRYFILDTDRENVDKLLIENDIIASTETITNYDYREQKKLYKVCVWVAISITLLILFGLIIEFLPNNPRYHERPARAHTDTITQLNHIQFRTIKRN